MTQVLGRAWVGERAVASWEVDSEVAKAAAAWEAAMAVVAVA